jgi:G:T-mismatch repair DNA endonuclease (very short patch repair protein)
MNQNHNKKQTWWDKKTPEEQKKISEKRKKTCLEKYGVEYTSQIPETRKLAKKTWLEKYGVEHPLQNKEIKEKTASTNLQKYGYRAPTQSLEVLEKRKQNNNKKYGVDSPSKLNDVKEKVKNTCLKKYGTKSPFQNKQIQDQAKKIWMEKYGVNNPSKLESVKEKKRINKIEKYFIQLFNSNRLKNLITPLFTMDTYKGTKNDTGHLFYKFQCNKCGNIFDASLANGQIPRCFKCHPVSNFTIPHKIVCEYLDSQNIPYEVEKYIKPYSVDIFVEPNKIIEIYGDYWHGNPKFYKEDDEIHFTKDNFILVKERRNKDKARIDYLTNKGNETLIIWENDIKNNWNNTQRRILEFKEL